MADALRDAWMRHAGLPAEYRAVSLAPSQGRGDGRGVATAARAKLKHFCDHLPDALAQGRQLVLLGPVGVGKSCCLGVVAQAAYHHGIRTRYVTVAQVCDMAHADGADEQLRNISRVPLLLLDDWGAEYGSEYHDVRLSTLIDDRWSNRRATIVTSNLTEQRLRTEYPGMERTWDRLFDPRRTEVLVITGESRRTSLTRKGGRR